MPFPSGRRPLLAALLGCAALLACAAPGRAQRIGTRSDGGTLMLSANNDRAWDSAKEIMSAQCDGSYRVLDQAIETAGMRGGPPPATPSAMADPVGPAGAPYGMRVDYACTRTMPPPTGDGPSLVPVGGGQPAPAPSGVPPTQTPAGGASAPTPPRAPAGA